MIKIRLSSFSKKARSLWAKKSRNGDLLWLPLPTHLTDTVEVAYRLWRYWVPEGVKRQITAGLNQLDAEEAEKFFIFLAATHDLGKATPVFASQSSGYWELDSRIHEQIVESGLPMENKDHFISRNKTPHALASQVILTNAGCPESVAVILGAHHGKPPDLKMLDNNITSFPENYILNTKAKPAWREVQNELIHFALFKAGYNSLSDLPEPNITAQVLLSGLLIVADWISSDERLFPYVYLDDPVDLDSEERAERAWRELGFAESWTTSNEWMGSDLYQLRFGYDSVYPIQQFTKQALDTISKPGIMVIEASMGSGKTEAALVAAEIMADLTKRKGVFFALPTQATSDGIFPRLVDWLEHLGIERASARLMHGKAQFNDTFRNLAHGTNINMDEDTEVFVHEWFNGRKRAILDDFVVGTIDQLLMAALKQKHVMLRHLGLANKVVIIDECHAFDAYMNSYLERALNWLGAYGVPVIVLSATLPFETRKMVIEAYCNKRFDQSKQFKILDPLNKSKSQEGDATNRRTPEWIQNRAYPLITYTDGHEVKQLAVTNNEAKKHVQISELNEQELGEKLDELLEDGGCAGIIVNSVSKAQMLARQLKGRFGNDAVQLFHSRFITRDRFKKEEILLNELGKPGKGGKRPNYRIVVGTQVLEQSLDIDFDVLITEICPMDLLLQRLGRLHRHVRPRPEKLKQPMCFVIGMKDDGFDEASSAIYGDYLLMRTRERLPEAITVPDDIPELVQDVYDASIPLVPDTEAYRQATRKHQLLLDKKRDKAEAFRVNGPKIMDIMIDWLNTDVSDKRGEAAVRDTSDTFDVLLIQQDASGTMRFLPWIHDGKELDRYREPPADVARELARCSVQLPVSVCGRFDELDATIEYLEQLNKDTLAVWQQSPWLRGELFLILDEQLSTRLKDYRLSYHPDYGLEYAKEEGDQLVNRQNV